VRPEAQANEAVLPDGLRDVVGRRLSRLSDKTNQVLSVAAVMGREFRLDVLEKLASLPEEELFAALEEAQGRAIIEQRQLAGTLGFRFNHAFFRTTLYEEIFAPRRIRLHQQVGSALEGVYARHLNEHAAELAEHFSQSTETADLEKAVHYGELAAQRAMSVYAYSEAVRHLEQSLRAQEVLDPDNKAKRCDLLLKLCEAWMNAGDPRRVSEEVADESFVLAQATHDEGRTIEACKFGLISGYAFANLQFYATDLGRRWLERADQNIPVGSRDRLLVDNALASNHYQAGRFGEAFRLRVRVFEDATKLNDEQVFLDAGTGLVTYHVAPHAEDVRWRAAQHVAEVEMRPRDPTIVGLDPPLGRISIGAAFVYLAHGQRDLFERWHQEFRLQMERRRVPGSPWLRIDGLLHFLDGRLEQALESAASHLSASEEAGRIIGATALVTNLTLWPLLYLGRYKEALDSLKLPVEAAGATELTFMTGRRALCFAFDGKQEAARPLLDAAFAPVAAVTEGEDWTTTRSLIELIAAAVLLGEDEKAALLTERLAPAADFLASSSAGDIACPARHLGDACALLDRPAEARGYYNQALEVCAKVRFRPELALTRLGLAELLLEHYPDERPAAIEHLDFAIREFREMKMQPSLERALRHRELLKA
jgi:tetratricopeptide (TPR) repeat protein